MSDIPYRLLLEIAQEVASWGDCEEDKEHCDYDSGPMCKMHGDNWKHSELIALAKFVVSRAE